MSTEVGRIHYKLDLDDTKFKAGLSGATQKTGVFKKTLGGLSVGSLAAGAGIMYAGRKALQFGKDSVGAFFESQKVGAQLNAVLKSTGGAAGITAERANELATEMSKLNAIDDEAILEAENMMLTFTNIGKNVFPTATQAAIDMATAMNGGATPSADQLRQQTIQLGKALQDPDRGLGALRRVGVNTDELRKKFTELMPIEEKQRLILKELGTEFGGSGAAAAQTYQGRINALKVTFGNLQERIGQFIVNGLMALLRWFGQVRDALIAVWRVIGPVIMPALRSLWNTISTQLIPALRKLWAQIAPVLIPILKVLGKIVGGVIVAALWLFINILRVVISWISKLIGWFSNAIKFAKNFAIGVGNAIKGIPGAIKNALRGVWEAITAPFRKAFDWLKEKVEGVKGFLQKLNPFHRESPSLVDMIQRGTRAITGMYGNMFDHIGAMSQNISPVLRGAAATTTNAQSSVRTNIYGNINIGSEVDGGRLLARLTRNQELINMGLAPRRQ